MSLFALLLAQDPAPQGGGPGILGMVMPLLLIFAVMYLLMIRPMRKQEQQRQAMIAQLKKNDKVVTNAGIIGTVAEIAEGEDEITLKIDPSSNVRLKVLRSSVARVIAAPTDAAAPQQAAKT
jgi:preprotein translocase subunit YajC